jgi:uncharacterized phage protein (TIGR02216 family)
VKAKPAAPFPWEDAMRAGLGQLRLAPQDFWAMTLPELNAALRGTGPAGPAEALPRAALDALMALYPDHEERDDG